MSPEKDRSHTQKLLSFDAETEPVLLPEKIIPRDPRIPETCVLCFFQDAISHRVENEKGEKIRDLRSEIGPNPVYVLGEGTQSVTLCHPGVGAPLTAGFMEELIALGCRRFFVCGGAGTLREDFKVGKLVVVREALRDEGTSYHYLAPGEPAVATPTLNEALKEAIAWAGMDYAEGVSWTTDAMYRETRSRVKERQEQGCLVVEMEASALFAVAAHRRVEIGYLVYCGDMVAGEAWDSRGWQNKAEVRQGVLSIALDAARNLPRPLVLESYPATLPR